MWQLVTKKGCQDLPSQTVILGAVLSLIIQLTTCFNHLSHYLKSKRKAVELASVIKIDIEGMEDRALFPYFEQLNRRIIQN